MDNLIPRHDLCLVRKIAKEARSIAGIYIPDNGNDLLVDFEIISVGNKVEDLKPGDRVFAEDAMQSISKLEKNVGLLNQKYIHLIYGK